MTNSYFKDRKFKIAFLSWWAIWSVFHLLVLLDGQVAARTALADCLVSNVLLAASCWMVANNLRYYLPRREQYWYALVIAFGFSGIWLLAVRLILGALFKSDTAYLSMLSQTSFQRYAIAFLINACMVAINLLLYTQKDKEENARRKIEMERLNREAELFKLQQQLQPHFLFNSLNSISALTAIDPGKARHMIEQLSGFLRGTLNNASQATVLLSDELEQLERYLDIEKVRFGHRLQTNIIVAEELDEMKLPGLLLQPLVENAIKFGLYDTLGDVLIEVIAGNRNGNLEVLVRNPYDDQSAGQPRGTGFGLASVQRRLYLLFGRSDLLEVKTKNGIFTATLLIPQS